MNGSEQITTFFCLHYPQCNSTPSVCVFSVWDRHCLLLLCALTHTRQAVIIKHRLIFQLLSISILTLSAQNNNTAVTDKMFNKNVIISFI